MQSFIHLCIEFSVITTIRAAPSINDTSRKTALKKRYGYYSPQISSPAVLTRPHAAPSLSKEVQHHGFLIDFGFNAPRAAEHHHRTLFSLSAAVRAQDQYTPTRNPLPRPSNNDHASPHSTPAVKALGLKTTFGVISCAAQPSSARRKSRSHAGASTLLRSPQCA